MKTKNTSFCFVSMLDNTSWIIIIVVITIISIIGIYQMLTTYKENGNGVVDSQEKTYSMFNV